MKNSPDFTTLAYDSFSFGEARRPAAAPTEAVQTYEQIPVRPVFTAADLPANNVLDTMPGIAPCPELAQELIAFCSKSLARQKVPRSIDFENELPRLPTGKLYKRILRDRYWGNRTSRIV